MEWNRLDQLLYEPLTTPVQWCEQRPCVQLGSWIVNEPLSSVLVFALAILWVAVGVELVRRPRGQRSRRWLGVALVLGGIGAVQAGISYQAFSYLLKCAGREYCLLTDELEVGYSVTQAVSVGAMLIAVAYACTTGTARRTLIAFALLDSAAYLVLAMAGMVMPSRTLLSFEVLMLFALPGILLVIVLAARARDTPLLTAAVSLLLVQIAYFAYALAGITAMLWQGGKGFYFSANDVLHVGMIAWLVYVAAAVAPRLRDHPGS